jgi:hypothetical protein
MLAHVGWTQLPLARGQPTSAQWFLKPPTGGDPIRVDEILNSPSRGTGPSASPTGHGEDTQQRCGVPLERRRGGPHQSPDASTTGRRLREERSDRRQLSGAHPEDRFHDLFPLPLRDGRHGHQVFHYLMVERVINKMLFFRSAALQTLLAHSCTAIFKWAI